MTREIRVETISHTWRVTSGELLQNNQSSENSRPSIAAVRRARTGHGRYIPLFGDKQELLALIRRNSFQKILYALKNYDEGDLDSTGPYLKKLFHDATKLVEDIEDFRSFEYNDKLAEEEQGKISKQDFDIWFDERNHLFIDRCLSVILDVFAIIHYEDFESSDIVRGLVRKIQRVDE
jgi:hypothetical protein